jgi:hypothetical protein
MRRSQARDVSENGFRDVSGRHQQQARAGSAPATWSASVLALSSALGTDSGAGD